MDAQLKAIANLGVSSPSTPKGLGESNPFWFLSISIKLGEATPENKGHAYKR